MAFVCLRGGRRLFVTIKFQKTILIQNKIGSNKLIIFTKEIKLGNKQLGIFILWTKFYVGLLVICSQWILSHGILVVKHLPSHFLTVMAQ